MSIQERINDDIKTAMKARDTAKLNDLRLIKSELQRGEKVVSDDKAIKVLKSMRKATNEMLDIQIENDAASDDKMGSLRLIETLNSYLPTELSQRDVELWVKENISQMEAKNFGLTMKRAMSELPDGTNGKFVAKAIKSIIK